MTIIVEFETLDGREADFSTLIGDHARRTLHEEPGCLSFDVIQLTEIDGTPVRNRFMVVEVYADDAAIATHNQSPRLALVRDAVTPLLKSRRRVVAKQIGVEAAEEGLTPDQLNAANDG